MSTLPAPLHKFLADKKGNIVVAQRPNAPIIIWAIFAVLARLLHYGILHTSTQLVSHAAIIIWALLEVYSGASPFRRTLGAVVLLLTVASLLR